MRANLGRSMLRFYGDVGIRFSVSFAFSVSRCVCGESRFFAAIRADVHVFAQRNFQRFQNIFIVEAEALAVGYVADVGAEFAVGPEEIADRGEELLDVIVLLDQRGDIAGGARGGNVLQRLRGLRVEANARDILAEHGDETEAEALIEIGDELVARHFFELPIVAEALLERQVPVHVVGIPPGVLQALPEQARLADAADFVAARDDAFFAILANKVAEGVHEFRLYFFEALVVRAQIDRRCFCCGCRGSDARGIAGIAVSGRGRAGPGVSCAIRVHASSSLPCRPNSAPVCARLRFYRIA